MHKWQSDVFDFHEKFNLITNDIPTLPSRDEQALRLRLILEEVTELEKAIQDQNMEEVADSIVDAIYVLLAMAVSFGIDIEPIWDEVHQTNMRKERGKFRADGKVLKPLGWLPPEVK